MRSTLRAVPAKGSCPLFASFPECNLSCANGIWLADLDADAWKLKVHHGFLQPLGTLGSLALFTPPRDEPDREKWQRHQNYAGHILSEEWQKRPNSTYRWVPEGSRPGHLSAAHRHTTIGPILPIRPIQSQKHPAAPNRRSRSSVSSATWSGRS